MSAPLTAPQTRALAVLGDRTDDVRGIRPRAVAKALWPDSPAWENRTRRYGSNRNGAVGGTMPMKAATLLWKLWQRGCAWEDDGDWRITDLGRRVLAGTDQPRPLPERAAEPVRDPKPKENP